MAGTVAEKFVGGASQVVEQYVTVQPAGALMSVTDVSLTLVGSICMTISCATVPVPATGIAATRSRVLPGNTVAGVAVTVTAALPEAPAAVAPATSVAATVATARPDATKRRRGDMVIRP